MPPRWRFSYNLPPKFTNTHTMPRPRRVFVFVRGICQNCKDHTSKTRTLNSSAISSASTSWSTGMFGSHRQNSPKNWSKRYLYILYHMVNDIISYYLSYSIPLFQLLYNMKWTQWNTISGKCQKMKGAFTLSVKTCWTLSSKAWE